MKLNQLFSSPLGAQVAPIGSFRPKCGAEIASGIIQGVAGLGSAIANYYSQKSANDTNMQINENNLAWQREQWKQQQENFHLQRKWQLEDAASERNYNSLQSQVARYRAAGLNPSLAMYGGAGQNQVSTGSVTPSAPSGSFSGASLEAKPIDFSGFGIAAQNAVNAYWAAQRNETDMQVAKQHVQNESLDTMSKMIQRGFQNEHFKKLAEQIAQQIKFDNENWSERSNAIKYANDKIKADQLLVEEQTKAQRFANEVAPELNNLQKKVLASNVAQAAAAVAELNSRTDLNNKEKELVTKKITEQVLINGNLPKSLHNDNAIKVATYNQIKAQAANINQRTETEKWNTKDAQKFYRIHLGNQRTVGEQLDPIDVAKALKDIKKK